MTNYTIIQNETITSYLSDKAFRLYSLLESMAYGDRISCYPSQKYLAVALRCSVRTIQRALQELRDNKLITITRRGSISNIYTLVQKKIQQGINKLKNTIKGHKKREVSSNTLMENTFTESDCNKSNNYNKKQNYYKKNYYNKIKKDNFNNYNQRNYDYNKLEKILLGQEKYDPNILEK